MPTTAAQNVLRVDVVEDAHGIPHAKVTSTGDATLSETQSQATEALAAYRLEQLKRPFPGELQLVDHGQSGPDRFVTVFAPERIL